MELSPADRALAARIAAAHPLRNARNIPRLTIPPMRGNDLVAQNDEPEPFTEGELIAADLASNENKAQRAADREFAEAMRHQMRANNIADVIARRS